MNLTIQQVSKLTKLSAPTLYAYASRYKLGKRIGNKRFFTQADVQIILKGIRKPPAKKKAKSPVKKKAKSPVKKTRKRTVKAKQIAAPKAKPTAVSPEPTTEAVKSPKPSFWTRLFGGRKQRQKVSLMDAKTTK